MTSKTSRLVYSNGEWVKEEQASLSIFDSAIQLGNSLTEVTRTFSGRSYKLDEHLNRLWRSMRAALICSPLSPEELRAATLQTLEANLPALQPSDDYQVCHIVSAGRPLILGMAKQSTLVIYCSPISTLMAQWGHYYRDGVHVITPRTRHIPPQCLDPQIKYRSRMHMCVADLEAKSVDPQAYAVLLDIEGRISEGTGANLFVLNGKRLQTPARNILHGISRATVLEMAPRLGLQVEICDLQPYDVVNADEAFLTSTPFCLFPISKVNNLTLGHAVPGPITDRILHQWREDVGLDFVKQGLLMYEQAQTERHHASS
jgi:branched-chain amino acid aminotransferase